MTQHKIMVTIIDLLLIILIVSALRRQQAIGPTLLYHTHRMCYTLSKAFGMAGMLIERRYWEQVR